MNGTFPKWTEKTATGQMRYDVQTAIIAAALASHQRSLDVLLDGMRTSNEPCVYVLGGTRLNNAYSLGSNDIAAAISVLPEDGDKAAVPGYHPGSTEVYVVFQGSLVIETVTSGTLHGRNAGPFDVVVLPPGVCHRVRHETERQAASFIVKTNPHHEPKVVRCGGDCIYYPGDSKSQCPLYRSWMQQEATVHDMAVR